MVSSIWNDCIVSNYFSLKPCLSIKQQVDLDQLESFNSPRREDIKGFVSKFHQVSEKFKQRIRAGSDCNFESTSGWMIPVHFAEHSCSDLAAKENLSSLHFVCKLLFLMVQCQGFKHVLVGCLNVQLFKDQ